MPLEPAVIIPVKSLHQGKSRLSSLLTSKERFTLNHTLLMRTLHLAQQLVRKKNIFVISNCRMTLDYVRDTSTALLEEEDKGLNGALEQASRHVRQKGMSKIFIFPCDLVATTPEDIRLLFTYANDHEMVIATDRAEIHTNALYLNTTSEFRFQFGENSLNDHLTEAKRCGLKASVMSHTNLSFDLDTPEDYALYLSKRST